MPMDTEIAYTIPSKGASVFCYLKKKPCPQSLNHDKCVFVWQIQKREMKTCALAKQLSECQEEVKTTASLFTKLIEISMLVVHINVNCVKRMIVDSTIKLIVTVIFI